MSRFLRNREIKKNTGLVVISIHWWEEPKASRTINYEQQRFAQRSGYIPGLRFYRGPGLLQPATVCLLTQAAKDKTGTLTCHLEPEFPFLSVGLVPSYTIRLFLFLFHLPIP